ncbi:MAG TPA: chemotaxis response regulator protein-glutamate methylesterase [Candidatus Omnitrophota bacterium]|nr:chemotaxis response regulator protein-glutamate methylesterase [Candidatus Omnitrophota bacterium]
MIEKKVKVLVVDDSFLMRKIISDAINSDPALEVVYKAKNGQEGLQKILELKPDIVTLDINLPIMNGLSVLQEVMKKQPCKVIMLSAYTREGAADTMKALELGAIDFIAKPSGEISLDIYKLKDEITSKIKLAARIKESKFLNTLSEESAIRHPREKAIAIKKLVIIGASTGGPKAVLEIMQDIPAGLQAAFLIVQHMPAGFTTTFAERLSWQSKLKAKEAQEGDTVMADKILVAPAGYHLILEQNGKELKTRLNQDSLVNFVRPSIDVTMYSAVEAFHGKDIIAVILTGMGKDGLDGCRKIKEAGGTILIQDEASSVVWGMPGAVYEAGLSDKVLPVSKIAEAIVKEINR